MSGEQLRDLLKDKAFVDYFNIFLCQPVFGFRIMYNLDGQKFVVDPKLRQNIKKLTNSKLLIWLETERLPLFVQSPMYFEYKLCTELRELQFSREVFDHSFICGPGQLDETLIKLIVQNIFGHYIGMQQFKIFLSQTSGEKVWQCIQDVLLFCNKRIKPNLKKYELHHLIMKYLANGTLYELSARLKLHLFCDSDRFKTITMEASASDGAIFNQCLFHNDLLMKEPEEAMFRFHRFLVEDLVNYWAPCFVLHILQERISSNLECLCRLNFSEEPGSLRNIENLFESALKNCPWFKTAEIKEDSPTKDRYEKQSKLPPNIQEYLFGDEFICHKLHMDNTEMTIALISDKLSGYPFFNFLMNTSESDEDVVFLLWEDLCRYIHLESKDFGDYIRKLQELKIKNVYLENQIKSQDDLLRDVLQHISGFETGDAKGDEKISNLVKAAHLTTKILLKPWQNFIDYEKKQLEDIFNCHPDPDEDSDEDSDECRGDLAENFDGLSLLGASLAVHDINQVKNDNYQANTVLSCLFKDEEVNKIASIRGRRQRRYERGKDIFKSLKSSEEKFRNRPVKKMIIPKSKITTIPFKDPEPQIRSMKILFELKAMIKGKKQEHVIRERHKIKSIGVNPYLSIRKMKALNIIDHTKRKRILLRKCLKILCQFLHEMLKPYMKDLLVAYVDELAKKSHFQEEQQSAVEKYSKFVKNKLKRSSSIFNPPQIYYARLRKKIIYLSNSLRFKRNAYMLLKSGQRSKINRLLKNKARNIITNFQQGSLFTQDKSDFVFGCAQNPTKDIAADVALKLKSEGASCGLFHKLDLHVIPVVFQIWKRMSLDCLMCGGRPKFLALMGIDRVAFEKKVQRSKEISKQMSRWRPEEPGQIFKLKRIRMEEQGSLLASSLLAFFGESSDKYHRHFTYNAVECLSPDLRKLIQQRGGSQFDYVYIR